MLLKNNIVKSKTEINVEEAFKEKAKVKRVFTEAQKEALANARKIAAENRAAKKALDDGFHGYTPANGLLELRQGVSRHIKKMYGANVDASKVVIMPGGKPTMFFAILMFGQHGTEIIYPEPGFPIYESMINYSGAKAIPMYLKEENNFSFKAEEVLKLINNKTLIKNI